ncbi:MAG: efflux RND transporter periplasmic adaptor subunit [Planctomycetales bacterium]|nr:efflux RND transporter periplasmic adaptor subunit [Planctomycetales bacterium]
MFRYRDAMDPLRFLGVISVCLLGAMEGQTVYGQRGPAVVEVAPLVQKAGLSPTQSTVGTVDPARVAVVGSAVDGRVVEMFVREGDRVEKDQPLATLLTETIKLELEAAEAELELKRQELLELENGSRPEELEQTMARVEATRVTADYLEKERQRVESLRSSSAISAAEYARAASLANEARKRYDEAQAAHKLAVAGPRAERIAQARAQVAMDDAVVRKLADQVKKHTMYARFSGYVTAEHTEVGEWLPKGNPVAEIIELDQVEIVAKVLEIHIPFIHVGDVVPVVVPALPGETFEGKVSAIIPKADVRSRTFPVKILVANRLTEQGEPTLKAGMLARVELPIGESPQALLVPKDALVLGGATPFVWIIGPGTVQKDERDWSLADAIQVPVKTGAELEGMIEISLAANPVQADGNSLSLKAGMLVVVRGNERITPSRPGQPPSQVTWR